MSLEESREAEVNELDVRTFLFRLEHKVLGLWSGRQFHVPSENYKTTNLQNYKPTKLQNQHQQLLLMSCRCSSVHKCFFYLEVAVDDTQRVDVRDDREHCLDDRRGIGL